MRRFLFLVFSFFLLNACAQIDVTWGVPQKQVRKTQLTSLLGEDANAVYAVRADLALFGSREPIIERYRKSDMGLEYSKHVSMRGPNGIQLESQNLFMIHGHIVILGSAFNTTKDQNVLYASVLDDHANAIKPWTEVASVSTVKRNNIGSFFATLSRDSNTFLVIVNPPYDRYANEKYTLKLFDGELKEQWHREIEPPYKDQYFALNNFIVSANGDVYMLATISKDKSVMSWHERRTVPTYYHTVLLYERSSDELKEYKVELDPKFISDVKITINDSGDIVCAGFYSNKSSNAIIGSFFLKIDKKTKEIVKKGNMDFSKEFLEEFMSTRKVTKGKELNNYDLKYLVLREDGGAVLVAEQFYEILVQSYDPASKMYTYTYYYYYNEIIVISINSDGHIEWQKKIPKYQMSRNDLGYYSSFSFAVCGDKMYFMFNDHPKNMNVPDGKSYKWMSNPRKSIAVLVTMDSRGHQERQAMFSNKDLKIILRPKLYMQSSEHQLYLYGEKGSTYKLASVRMS